MSTALELSRDELERYLETARRRSILPALTSVEREEREVLIGRVREAATVLKTRFGARRVVLFGSLSHEAWFTPDSDVDLAVEGLGSSDYWVAWRVVEGLNDDREVDLIEIEMASDSLRKAIQRYGMEV